MERSNGRLFFHFQVMKIGLFNVTRERERESEGRENHFPLPLCVRATGSKSSGDKAKYNLSRPA